MRHANNTLYRYNKHSRTCPGGKRGQLPPKFPRFGQNLNFSGSDKKIFGQNHNFSGSNTRNLGKVKNFRAVTMINCKKLVKTFFYFFYFFKDHHDFRTKFCLHPRTSENFFVLSVKYKKS